MAGVVRLLLSRRVRGRLLLMAVRRRRRSGVVPVGGLLVVPRTMLRRFLRRPVGLGAGRFRVGVRRGGRW